MNESWIEKFRPNNLNEISSQEEIILSLKNCIKKKNITHLLIDGTGWEKKYGSSFIVESIVKGDSLYYSIAAASIIAKEHHDAHIKELVNNNPELDTKYSLLSNMGYPTVKHFDGIKKYGCSEYHRKSFRGVIN